VSYEVILRITMSGMDFVYNQLMKHETSINDLQRLYPTINMALDDINDLKRFRDLYRSDIIDGVAKSTLALESYAELNYKNNNTTDNLNNFIKTFNQWADIIKGLQTSVEGLKKENIELRDKLTKLSSKK
jgi:hypothetical protein